jgi:GDP-4-dehydro-6-deoxy-D-mannose reductase
MKVLITGVTGFVGKHLAEYLLSEGVEVWGAVRPGSQVMLTKQSNVPINLVVMDLINQTDMINNLNKINPDQIYHLAGYSSVRDSWEQMQQTFDSNVRVTVGLLESIKKSRCFDNVRVLTVGSSEEYGRVGFSHMPIREDEELNPISPYGLSKAEVSRIANYYYRTYGMKIIHARPFNHIGPGQRLGFVVPDFANQIVGIEKGYRENVLSVGNLDAQRDFTDVRDIVKAYYKLLSSNSIPFGEPINICSGKANSIKYILSLLLSLARIPIEISIDQSKIRPSDMPLYVGDCSRINEMTGWIPEIPIHETLIDVLNFIRGQSRGEAIC